MGKHISRIAGPTLVGLLLPILLTTSARAVQDVVFLMDSSGSVGSSNWSILTTFVDDIVTNSMPATDRAAMVPFATGIGTPYNLTDDQTRTVISGWLAASSYLSGWTDVDGAIDHAVNTILAGQSPAQNAKLLVLIIDGNPILNGKSQDLCVLWASTLAAAGIKVIVVGIGAGWNPTYYNCLVADVNDIIEVADFGSLSYAGLSSFLDPYFLATPVPSMQRVGVLLLLTFLAIPGILALRRNALRA